MLILSGLFGHHGGLKICTEIIIFGKKDIDAATFEKLVYKFLGQRSRS